MKKIKIKNSFSIQIQCLESELCYVTALYKAKEENNAAALEEAKNKAMVLKTRLFGSKECLIEVIDEINIRKYKIK